MAFIPYFVVGPTSIMGLIGLLHGPDRIVPTPTEDWKKATIDLLIPSYNEEKTIVLCLASIMRQTIKPRQIFLIDDASKDRTIQYAEFYAEQMGLNLKIIHRDHNEGKTPSVHYMLHNSDADLLAVVDGDTILKSNNYLERLIQELYQGVGIACACGVILPLTETDREIAYKVDHIQAFSDVHPDAQFSPDRTGFQKFQRRISNSYREELYLFLQRYIYHGEMVFFGTLVFPIGCAVVYRRQYLKNIFDQYEPFFGLDFTTSEDIFFGFAFATEGYRSIVIQDVYGLTMEPRILKIYHQIFKWSSSFLQSCFYFDDLFLTPFKLPAKLKNIIKNKHNPEHKKNLEKRKIKEAYRQQFGKEYTKKYGRNIGWFVFTTAVEKISFPTFIIVFILLKQWTLLLITIGAEMFLYTIIITLMHKNRRIKNFIKAILFTPIRYSQLLFDFFVIGKFIIDLWVTRNRQWRK